MSRRTEIAILRARALTVLEVTEAQLSVAPSISPQLRMISLTLRRAGQDRIETRAVRGEFRGTPTMQVSTIRSVPYGMGTNLLVSWPQYLRMIDDPDARQILGAWVQCPSPLRSAAPIEAFCLAAHVSPLRALEMITLACVRIGAQASAIISAINHPRVVQKTVEMALTDDGHDDRADLHKATGFLPTARGPSVVVNANSSASATATAQSATVSAPPPEQTIRRAVDRFNDARPTSALPAATVVEVPSTTRELEPVEVADRDDE